MNSSGYVTYAQIEECAKKHFLRYGKKVYFKDTVMSLFENGQCNDGLPDLPRNVNWSRIGDEEFYSVLDRLPVGNTFDISLLPGSYAGIPLPKETILAELIMPEALEVYAIKYIPYIIEEMHKHNFFEINYVMKGHCKMIFENTIRELHSGELCIIAPQSMHDVTIDDANSVVLSLMLRKNTFETTFIQLLAQEDLLASFFRSILYSKRKSANYMLFSTDNSETIGSSLKDIFMECYVSDTYSNICVTGRIHLLFSHLLRRYADTIQFFDDQQQNPEFHGSFIQVIQYIQNNYRSVTLDQLAEHFHYNPSYMSRLIKKRTGQRLTDILTQLKLTKATNLLLRSDLKIDEIAALSGYQTTDHFSRLFKQKYGTSPVNYRQKAKNN